MTPVTVMTKEPDVTATLHIDNPYTDLITRLREYVCCWAPITIKKEFNQLTDPTASITLGCAMDALNYLKWDYPTPKSKTPFITLNFYNDQHKLFNIPAYSAFFQIGEVKNRKDHCEWNLTIADCITLIRCYNYCDTYDRDYTHFINMGNDSGFRIYSIIQSAIRHAEDALPYPACDEYRNLWTLLFSW